MIFIMLALAHVAHNQGKCCIRGFICGNREQGVLNPNKITLKKEGYSPFVFIYLKESKWCLIAISVEEDELPLCLPQSFCSVQ